MLGEIRRGAVRQRGALRGIRLAYDPVADHIRGSAQAVTQQGRAGACPDPSAS